MEEYIIRKPFAGDFPVTQEFGAVVEYRTGRQTHKGIDWGLPCGTEVLSAAPGIVQKIDREYTDHDYGINITIVHKGFRSFYAHLQEVRTKVGEEVVRGSKLALSGKTGFCRGKTGCHLHFGIKTVRGWIDPMEKLNEKEEELEYVPVAGKKLVALYRLYNPEHHDHFYTTSELEVEDAKEKHGYVSEGILGFIVGEEV